MGKYKMTGREIPLDDSWDVIVVGGGPTGCTAASSAAREGGKTLLIEATSALGGMGTLGLVPAWCPFSDKEKIIYGGLAQTVFTKLKEQMDHVDNEAMDWVPIDPERLKRLYDDMVTETGASILFNTTLCSVEMDDKNNVSALIMSNKKGLAAYKAKVYVDCTGDADLATWAGANFEKGDQENGELQPATHCFILSNIDIDGYQYGPELHGHNSDSPIYDIITSDKYPLIVDGHICNNQIGPSTLGFNAGHLWEVDNTNPASVSKALIKGRKLAAQFRDALAEYHPRAFANSFLVTTGSLMGVRETRRIIGDYILTANDYLERRSFSDEICRNSYFIDIHLSRDEIRREKEEELDFEERTMRYGSGESHGIPYRCLTPEGLTNVLVAGRSISCDRVVQGSVRVMPVCLAMGEAAGMAAVHATRENDYDVHKIDVNYLRKRLKEEGAYLPDDN